MAGNVLEWTSSFYDHKAPPYVVRGGAFFNDAENCRCAFRSLYNQNNRIYDIGFRCARIKL
jgi:formylglycine-generating enzyme required for sulfatase activity